MIDAGAERVLPLPAQRVYELVADVESYPRFVPGWRHARVLRRDAAGADVEQSVHLLGRVWSFRSSACFEPPRHVGIHAGAPFRRFDLRWDIDALSERASRLRASLRAELDDPLLDALARHALPVVMQGIVDAFEERARRESPASGAAQDSAAIR